MSCQFTLDRQKPMAKGSMYTSQSPISLESRFRFMDCEEISEQEYPDDKHLGDRPFVLERRAQDVEFYFRGRLEAADARRMRVREIFLFPDLNPSGFDGPIPQSRGFKQLFEQHPDLPAPYRSFEAQIDKQTCGRITAPAYVKVVEILPDEIEVKKPDAPSDPMIVASRAEKIQTGSLAGNTSTTILLANERKGCLSFPGFSGGGCLTPLLLLIIAGLLLWLIGSGNCQRNETPAPIIIHDTVTVEVQKTDTLLIVRKDTVTLVDSMTTVSYETINLPNVQFVSNSDVLLPSSAGELQKLAEYMLRNDSLTATIYGHTDSVGNPKSNKVLSQRRAESVKRFLSSLGVDPNRLEAVGMGDTEPRADNRTLEGRLINRRVEVKMTKTDVTTTKRTQVDNSEDRKVVKDTTERKPGKR